MEMPGQLANQATSVLTVLFITGNPYWIRPHQQVWQVDIMIDLQKNTVGLKFFRLNAFYSKHDSSQLP